MRAAILFAALLFLTLPTVAQQKLTTFILLRHAEKVSDGSKNPELTAEGKKRAEALSLLLKNTQVAAVFSTNYVRTRETVLPLAKSKSLELKFYEPFKTEAIDKILKEFEGKTIVICGHSNNIPWIGNYLSGSETLKDFADSDYSNLLIITVAVRGKESTTTWLTY